MNKNLWCADCTHCKSIEIYEGFNNGEKREYFIIECGKMVSFFHCLKRFYGFIKCGEFKSLDNDK